MQSHSKTALLLAVISVAAACKPQPIAETRVQSLDNFASNGLLTPNLCIGDEDVVAIAPRIEFPQSYAQDGTEARTVLNSLTLALSSVPEPVRALFFGHQGIVRIAPERDVAQLCEKMLTSPIDRLYASEGGQLSSCWEVSDEGAPRIYLSENLGVIRHHTVRMFGRVLAELFAEIPAQFGPTEAQAFPGMTRGSKDFRDLRAGLAQTFITEVTELRKKGDTNVSLSAYKDLVKSEGGRQTFSLYAFAESFDSYYCTRGQGGTRERMKHQFPQTYQAFTAIADRFFNRGEGYIDRLTQTRAARQPVNSARTASQANGFALDWSKYNPFTWVGNKISNMIEYVDPFSSRNNTYLSKENAELIYGQDSKIAKVAAERQTPQGKATMAAEAQEQADRLRPAKEAFIQADKTITPVISGAAVGAKKVLALVPDGAPGASMIKAPLSVVAAPLEGLDKLNKAGSAALTAGEKRTDFLGELSTDKAGSIDDFSRQFAKDGNAAIKQGVDGGLTMYKAAANAALPGVGGPTKTLFEGLEKPVETAADVILHSESAGKAIDAQTNIENTVDGVDQTLDAATEAGEIFFATEPAAEPAGEPNIVADTTEPAMP